MVRLMLVLGLVLSLAACGGSRTDGLSKSDEEALEARLEAAEAERAAAEADKVAAEADKAAAEADKVAAEADKAKAEADKAAAEADKAIAEADKVAAEAAQAAAEADKAIAEADKVAAEAAQAAAEADKAIAEADKVAAEAAQAAAEADKVAAEADKAIAEADKVTAEAAQAAAEADKAAAEADKAKAEADKAIAEAEVQYQLREADAARQEAAAARQDAVTARQEAATARGEAETARQETETAEQAQERLAAEADKARLEALQAEASVALMGFAGEDLGEPDDVQPKYRAPALVEEADLTPASPRGSSAGRWYATTVDGRGQTDQGDTTEDTIVVYSDVGKPTPTLIGQVYNDEDTADDANFKITIEAAHKTLIASSQFPRFGDIAEIRLTTDTDETPDMVNDEVTFSGTFDRAGGTFRCTNTGGDPCIVRHDGGGYVIVAGTLTFETAQSRKVDVADIDFMYFGWWRQKNEDGGFLYGNFSHPGMTPATGGLFTALGGSATYEGPAIGQYAVYEPLGTQSNYGEFKATARLTANFGNAQADGTLSGSISGFDVSSDWSLSLKQATISNGAVTDGNVSWTIDGHTEEVGSWSGKFHSNIRPYNGHIPDGLTGEFTAEFDNDGSLRGAYGAHKN